MRFVLVLITAVFGFGCSEDITALNNLATTSSNSREEITLDNVGTLHNEGMAFIDAQLVLLNTRNKDVVRATARQAGHRYLHRIDADEHISEFDREFDRTRTLKLALKQIDDVPYDEKRLLTEVLSDAYAGKLGYAELCALQDEAPSEYLAYRTFLAIGSASASMDPWQSIPPPSLDYWDIWVQDAVGGLIGGAFGGPPGAIGGALGASAGQLIDNYMN